MALGGSFTTLIDRMTARIKGNIGSPTEIVSAVSALRFVDEAAAEWL